MARGNVFEAANDHSCAPAALRKTAAERVPRVPPGPPRQSRVHASDGRPRRMFDLVTSVGPTTIELRRRRRAPGQFFFDAARPMLCAFCRGSGPGGCGSIAVPLSRVSDRPGERVSGGAGCE